MKANFEKFMRVAKIVTSILSVISIMMTIAFKLVKFIDFKKKDDEDGTADA